MGTFHIIAHFSANIQQNQAKRYLLNCHNTRISSKYQVERFFLLYFPTQMRFLMEKNVSRVVGQNSLTP